MCARVIAEGPDSFGFWSRYERAREQDATNREWGAELQAAAEAAAWWRYAAAVAWHDRGDQSAALRRLRQAQEHARPAGGAVGAEEAAVLADLAHRIRSTAWSRAAFKAHRAAFEQHRRGQDAEAAWRERVSTVAVAGARRAYFRWANPRYFGFH